MVAVPAEIPVTTPILETVATVGAELLHFPEAVASDRVVVLLTQTLLVPVIAAGAAGRELIVTTFTAELEHPPLVTV